MKKGESKWHGRRRQVECLIEEGLNGPQIAQRLGLKTTSEVYAVLKILELEIKPKPVVDPPNTPLIPSGAPLVGTPCTDEQGRPMTRYPARWAFGALMQSSIVRSRRK